MTEICEHIKTNGDRCGAVAMKNCSYCYFHERFHNPNDIPGSPEYLLPALEDHLSVQLFIMQVAKAQMCRSINSDMAAQYLTFARMAMQNLRLARLSAVPEKHSSAAAQSTVVQHSAV